MKRSLTVIDLFCGAGGFSDGFIKAGFKVIKGYDNWERARETISYNHPGVSTEGRDIIKLSKLPDKEFHKVFPDSDIIIGSPPCVAFSNSNRSGHADKTKGVRLLEAFFRVVARKKYKRCSILKYWILENVPNSKKYINREYSMSDLGLDLKKNPLKVIGENSDIYNALVFHVPQRRSRFFCGDFPLPIRPKNNIEPISLAELSVGYIQEQLSKHVLSDPNWPSMGDYVNKEITDNSYTSFISDWEYQEAKRQKQDKGYMGKMSLPERTDLPSRTVLAHQWDYSRREAIIYNGHEQGTFRAPTIRELATIMSFSLDYRFCGSSIAIKAKLIGNAVPPKMAYGFALAILKEQGLRAKYLGKRSKIDHNGSNGYEFINLNGNLFQPKPEYNRTFTSPFTYHIPYLKIKQFRVELTNKRKGLKDGIILFSPMIQYSSGKKARVLKLNINNSLFDKIRIPITDRWRISRIVRKINSHYQLQKNYCLTLSHRQINGDIGPIELLESVKRILNEESYNRPNRYIEYQSSDGMDFKIPYKIIAGYKILKMIIKALK